MKYFAAFLFVGILCTGCGGGSSDGDAGGGQGGEQGGGGGGQQGSDIPNLTMGTDCSISLALIAEYITNDVPNSVPSWDQLDCYIDDVERLALPSVFLSASDVPPDENGTDDPLTPLESFEFDEAIYAEWPSTTVPHFTFGEVPPFSNDDNTSFYPEDLENDWDLKLRAMATFVLLAKAQDYRATVAYFYPPSFFNFGDNSPWTEPQTREDFIDFWRNEYIPQRVALAEMAERVKAEYLQPWDIEPGQFVRAFGDQWLNDLSDDDQVAVTQQIVDELYTAVSAEFSGTLIVINYDRYAAVGDHWSEVDLSEWDQVHFALFTEGDVEGNEAYLDEQIDMYATIIARDGITQWAIQEVTVDPAAHSLALSGTGTSFADIEEDIYQSLFDKIATLTTPPIGIGITTGYIETDAARTLVETTFADYATNGL